MFKISIRTNILTLFAALMMAIGLIVVSIHYYTSSRLLIQSAENMLYLHSTNIEHEVEDFIQPARQRVSFGVNLMADGFIKPDQSPEFAAFMFKSIVDLPKFSGVFYGASNGNAMAVERSVGGTYNSEKIVSDGTSRYSIHTKLDSEGRTITKSVKEPSTFDPRVRPWYTKAIKAKKQVLSDVYLFFPFGEKKPVLGLTIAGPAYDKEQNLIGVYAIDLELRALSHFIANLKVSENASIFIFDNQNNLIAAKHLENISSTDPNQFKVSTVTPDWAYASFSEYQKHKKPLFFYNFHNTDYLAFYGSAMQLGGESYSLAIALPVDDITGPLTEQLLLSIAITILVLLVGMLFICSAANAISRPIMGLADETNLIRQLELPFASRVRSRIKEVIYMQEAFSAMKQSLRSFASYVPMVIVKKLALSGDLARVGGENKLATFLFSDITGFTSLSEGMEPQQLMAYLSEYFQAMTKVILEKGGTVDKYIGDAVMAFWGAPQDDTDQAFHACESALGMFDCLESLNKDWAARNLPELTMRIGINTGNAIIGNVGSADRLNYTAIGDSVNVANRIEEINKIYRTKTIVTHATYRLVKGRFPFRLLDNIAVRGKQEGVYIYELLSRDNQFGDGLAEYNDAFRIAFDYYQRGNFKEALSLFKALYDVYVWDDLLKMYLERCEEFQDHPPKDWSGVWRR